MALLAQAPNAQPLDLGQKLTLGVGGQPVGSVYDTPAVLVNILARNIFIVAGLILFAMIVYSGFKFIQAGSSKGKDEAQQIMTAAITGAIVIFAAYWIVRIVEVLTGTQVLF